MPKATTLKADCPLSVRGICRTGIWLPLGLKQDPGFLYGLVEKMAVFFPTGYHKSHEIHVIRLPNLILTRGSDPSSTTNIDNENNLQPETFPVSDAISKENRSQQQKMTRRNRLLTLLFGHSKASAEGATRRYLEDINSASCLNHLDKALNQLLDGIKDVEKIFSNYATTNTSGKRVWNRDSFAGYINVRLPENPAVTTCVPLLWCIFSIGAYFPFSAPSNEPEIDVKAFRRAFAFIVSRGYELLGANSNGQPFYTITEKFYTDKVPRLTRIIFRSLSTPWPQSGTQSQDLEESLQLQDIKDTIAFTQPIINENMHHGRATVADGEFEAAAYRLLLADHKGSTVRVSSIAISKADLQTLLQLLLLQRAEDRRWGAGLSFHDMYQRSGDIMFSRLISGPDEVSRASELASAFLAYQFPGGDDYVAWEQFKAFCSECVSISRVHGCFYINTD